MQHLMTYSQYQLHHGRRRICLYGLGQISRKTWDKLRGAEFISLRTGTKNAGTARNLWWEQVVTFDTKVKVPMWISTRATAEL